MFSVKGANVSHFSTFYLNGTTMNVIKRSTFQSLERTAEEMRNYESAIARETKWFACFLGNSLSTCIPVKCNSCENLGFQFVSYNLLLWLSWPIGSRTISTYRLSFSHLFYWNKLLTDCTFPIIVSSCRPLWGEKWEINTLSELFPGLSKKT